MKELFDSDSMIDAASEIELDIHEELIGVNNDEGENGDIKENGMTNRRRIEIILENKKLISAIDDIYTS